MVDSHTHILPFVDDGADSLEESYRMIEEAVAGGINHIILTPHVLRAGIPRLTKEQYIEKFNAFKEDINKKHSISLYLGQEISYHPQVIKYLYNKQLLTMNFTSYILLELPFYKTDINYDELFYSCSIMNYKVIIAHIERYDYLSYSDILKLKKYPVLLQVNSNAITGEAGQKQKKLSHRLFKDELIDLVGSDIHSYRKNDLGEAYKIISSHFSLNTANKIFYDNPHKIFEID